MTSSSWAVMHLLVTVAAFVESVVFAPMVLLLAAGHPTWRLPLLRACFFIGFLTVVVSQSIPFLAIRFGASLGYELSTPITNLVLTLIVGAIAFGAFRAPWRYIAVAITAIVLAPVSWLLWLHFRRA